MKALQVFFMLLPFSVVAQTDSSYGHSRFQQFLMEPGRMAHIATDRIGALASVELGSLTATDLNTGEKKRALCFLPGSLFNNGAFSSTNTQLDVDELTPLISILDTVNKINFSNKLTGVLEFRYVSSGLTEVVAANRPSNQRRWEVTIYRRYKQFQAPVPGSVISIRESDIEPLLQLLTRYKAALGNDLLRDL
jgi:hypothetical protein